MCSRDRKKGTEMIKEKMEKNLKREKGKGPGERRKEK